MVISHVSSRLRVGDDAPAVSEGRKVALPGGGRKQAHFRERSACSAYTSIPSARHCRGVFPNQRRHDRFSALCSE